MKLTKDDLASIKSVFDAADKPIEYDNVDMPKHYCSGAHECIDVMIEMFGIDDVIAFCKCNIFKYRFRSNLKNGDEDIKKAEWYEEKLIELNKHKYNLENYTSAVKLL